VIIGCFLASETRWLFRAHIISNGIAASIRPALLGFCVCDVIGICSGQKKATTRGCGCISFCLAGRRPCVGGWARNAEMQEMQKCKEVRKVRVTKIVTKRKSLLSLEKKKSEKY